ncbi:MAG TPA: hypothetical protein VHB99_00880 [Pirellulales bacterium]|nr:hypothetical protein [Pirellulales bacterium]
MNLIPTIFRIWTEGDERQLIALFPTIPADESGCVECYVAIAPFGQDGFSSGDFDEWMNCGRLAEPAEFARLMATIEELGRPCRPVARRTPEMLAEFEAALARLRE